MREAVCAVRRVASYKAETTFDTIFTPDFIHLDAVRLTLHGKLSVPVESIKKSVSQPVGPRRRKITARFNVKNGVVQVKSRSPTLPLGIL